MGGRGQGIAKPNASPPTFLREVDQGAMGGIANAPVLVVVCGDTRLTYAEAMDASVFPAVQNLLLAAHALGLGSTLTTLPVLGGAELSGLLGLPDRGGAGSRHPDRAPAQAAWARRGANPFRRRHTSTATARPYG